MHKGRTFPIGKFGEARGGNAKGNGRKKSRGERRSSEENFQGTANSERVSSNSTTPRLHILGGRKSSENYSNFHGGCVSSCRDPIPVPEKVRKPLTQVQKFNLHVDHRAVDRAEFDQKVK